MKRTLCLTGARLAFGMWIAMSAFGASFSFTSGTPDGRLGALSRRPTAGSVETETADDFLLQQTTVIKQAKVLGLLDFPTA